MYTKTKIVDNLPLQFSSYLRINWHKINLLFLLHPPTPQKSFCLLTNASYKGLKNLIRKNFCRFAEKLTL